jgi:hypothetical protein
MSPEGGKGVTDHIWIQALVSLGTRPPSLAGVPILVVVDTAKYCVWPYPVMREHTSSDG